MYAKIRGDDKPGLSKNELFSMIIQLLLTSTREYLVNIDKSYVYFRWDGVYVSRPAVEKELKLHMSQQAFLGERTIHNGNF